MAGTGTGNLIIISSVHPMVALFLRFKLRYRLYDDQCRNNKHLHLESIGYPCNWPLQKKILEWLYGLGFDCEAQKEVLISPVDI